MLQCNGGRKDITVTVSAALLLFIASHIIFFASFLLRFFMLRTA